MRKDLVNGFLVFSIALLAYLGTAGFDRKGASVSENPALYPQLLSMVLCMFGATLVAKALLHKCPKTPASIVEKSGIFRTLRIVISLVGYTVGIYLFGFIIPSLLFMFFVPLQLGASMKTALLVSAPLTIALYVTFFILFSVPIPHGIVCG